MTNHPPDGFVPGGTSPVFTQDTVPDAPASRAHPRVRTLGGAERARGQPAIRQHRDRRGAADLGTGPRHNPARPASQGCASRAGCAAGSISSGNRRPVVSTTRVRRIEEIMDSPNKIWKRGVRTAKAAEYVIVEDLPDDLKECYVAVLVWLVHVDDSQIDERELCEIQLLMTQLRCGAEVRKAVRGHLENPHSLAAHLLVDRIQDTRGRGKYRYRIGTEVLTPEGRHTGMPRYLRRPRLRAVRDPSTGRDAQAGRRESSVHRERLPAGREDPCGRGVGLPDRGRGRKGWRHRPHPSAFLSPPFT